MSRSLNETELLAKRAARGAGHCWGLAAEAARATRWLCARDIDGVAQLALLLRLDFAARPQRHRPRRLDAPWQGDDTLCPIMTGCLLSDCASTLPRRNDIHIAALAAPALLLPFAANAARILGDCISVSAGGMHAVISATELSASHAFPEQTGAIRIRLGGTPANPRRHQSRATPSPDAWELLEHLAHKTYAPATEQSRLLGAGAGLLDND